LADEQAADTTGSALPDDAIVIRGGRSARDTMMRSAELHFELEGEYGLSAYCIPETPMEQIAVAATLPHGVLRASTVGDLRRRGFDVVPDEPPHALIKLPNPPADSDLARVDECFGEPVPNPARE
jgi:hypothetical protein